MFDSEINIKKTKEQLSWIKKEINIQNKLYLKISKHMDSINPKREKWYREFLERIQTRGFNVDGDTKVKISPSQIPVKPKRANANKVVW